MSPKPLTSANTSKRAAPDPNDANVQSNAPSLHPPSTNNNGAQEPESSSSSAPPPYVRNTPLDNPRDLKAATATHEDPSPADPPPPLPSANDDPFSSGLRRGLHIPSRASHITWGFSFPEMLAEQGVTKPQWKLFTRELTAFASMSIGQWATVLACSSGLGIVFGYIAIPPGQSSSAASSRSILF